VLAELRRSFLAFSAIRRAASDMTPDAIDARLPALLTAVHHSAPAEVRLAEGTTLAVRIAAAVPGGATEAMLLGGSEAGARYGGPGIAGLITLTRAVTAAGGRLDRVLSGVSRREREAQPGLAALERNLGGLWRLLVGRDGRRGEAWWLDGLTPEGQAAVPLLMLDARPRVVFAADPGVAPGASSLDAAAAALDDAFHAWPVSAALSDDEEGS
jgi:hypothetical protein